MAVRSTMKIKNNLNVSPSPSSHDVGDVSFADIELLNKKPITNALSVKFADFKHLLSSQFSLVVLFATADTMRRATTKGITAFFVAISHIIGVSAKKKMLWIDTFAIIAMMADEQAIRNRANVKLIGDTASNSLLTIDVDSPISSTIALASCPIPAGIRSAAPVAVHKQPLFKWNTFGSHISSFLNSISRVVRTGKEVG